jgi:D-sedoheptulose 7-phosphate isomerase
VTYKIVKKNNFFEEFFKNSIDSINTLDKRDIQSTVDALYEIRKKGGRVFFVGVGGSAGNCSHAVNDFRKLCNIESYCVTDNVSELTARINDEGWDTSYAEWLKASNINKKDAIFVFSVGGGNLEKMVSVNIVNAVRYAKKKKAKVLGIVSRDGGYTKKFGDNVVVIPVYNSDLVTPISEALQSLIWHYLISTAKLKKNKTKW